jgi:drug/metabolite transporter (DMT)-like permease
LRTIRPAEAARCASTRPPEPDPAAGAVHIIPPVVALGLLLACAASALFATGVAIQALDARNAPERHALRPSLFGRLARRRRWLAGTLLSGLGWPFHLAALLVAPLTVVQPALASGLLLLLVLGHRILGERVGRREVVAVVAIVAGVGGMAWAAPDRVTSHAHAARLVLTLGGLVALALLPYVLRGRARSGLLVPLSAGCAFAWTGVSSKLVTDSLSSGTPGAALAWASATGLIAAVGLLSEMSALQSRPATQVAPIVFVVQVSVPVALAPFLGGESWAHTPLGGAAIAAFLVTVAAGAGLIGTTPAVGGLVAAAESS